MKLTAIKKIKYLLFIMPGFLIWGVFAFYPNILIYYYSIIDWDGVSKIKKYVGLYNFKALTYDSRFYNAIYNSIMYVCFYVALSVVVSLLFALILKENTKVNIFFRTYFFSPLVFSSVTIALIWSYMYDPNIGMINTLFDKVGLKFLEQNWLGTNVLDMFCIAVVSLWAGAGIPISIMLAGLSTIPNTLNEAARVEGASKYQAFVNVTFPLLLPTILRVSLLSMIGASLAFDVVYAMAGENSSEGTPFDTLAVYMYRSIFRTMKVGIPSAVGVILSVMVFMFFIIQFIVTKRIEDSIK